MDEDKISLLDLFEWYEIMHIASLAKKFNILSKRDRYVLYNYFGKPKMYLSRGMEEFYRDFDEWQIQQFDHIILELILNLPNDFQCDKPWCTACHKLTLIKNIVENLDKLRNIEDISYKYRRQKEEWELELELYRWQKECMEEWKRKGKGIVKVVTGAGKTILALEAIKRIKNEEDNVKFFIVVPTTALLFQWEEAIRDHLRGIEIDNIGRFYSTEWGNYEKDTIQIYVINSAREYLPGYNDLLRIKGYKTFLIADECHRYGSEKNSMIFNTTYDWYLGISAVPERTGDWGFEEILVPNLGEVIYEYTYADALKDGIIPPFTLINCAIELEFDEKREYEYLTTKINKTYGKLLETYPDLPDPSSRDYFRQLNYIEQLEKDKKISYYKNLLYKRRMLIHNARRRYYALDKILQEIYKNIDFPRIIIFHELIECANKIYKRIRNKYPVEIYHSKIEDRMEKLYNFRKGFSDILITCKALEEGLDVPNVNVGIIVASTKSVRQRIQRIGRILRKAPGKNYSYIYTIYIPLIDDGIFYKEEIKKLEGVAKVVNKKF